MYMMIKN